jgi:drug/metabolite transporter (DMT)-like permease
MNPFVLAGLLYLGAALAVAPFASVSRPSDEAIRRAAPRLTVAVVLGGAVGPVLLAVGLRQIPAVTVALLLNLELVFTAILAGLLLAWSGDARFRWGALIVAGACLCWAIDNGVTAKLDELAPVHITLAKGLVAGSANLMLGLAFGSAPSIGRVAAALLIGGFGYGASITLWIAGARELGAARGQLVFAAAPFVGALASWLALGDAVHLREVVSLVIALVGVSFVLRSDHEHRHGHARVEHEHEHGHDDGHHTGRDHDGSGGPTAGRHVHQHRHDPVVHAHPHLPDLHHRHDHDAH